MKQYEYKYIEVSETKLLVLWEKTSTYEQEKYPLAVDWLMNVFLCVHGELVSHSVSCISGFVHHFIFKKEIK